jgi:hypothetical protein
MNVETDSARDRWYVQSDRLVLTQQRQAEPVPDRRLTQLPGDEKCTVFMSRLDLPMNPTTVTNCGDYCATKAR